MIRLLFAALIALAVSGCWQEGQVDAMSTFRKNVDKNKQYIKEKIGATGGAGDVGEDGLLRTVRAGTSVVTQVVETVTTAVDLGAAYTSSDAEEVFAEDGYFRCASACGDFIVVSQYSSAYKAQQTGSAYRTVFSKDGGATFSYIPYETTFCGMACAVGSHGAAFVSDYIGGQMLYTRDYFQTSEMVAVHKGSNSTTTTMCYDPYGDWLFAAGVGNLYGMPCDGTGAPLSCTHSGTVNQKTCGMAAGRDLILFTSQSDTFVIAKRSEAIEALTANNGTALTTKSVIPTIPAVTGMTRTRISAVVYEPDRDTFLCLADSGYLFRVADDYDSPTVTAVCTVPFDSYYTYSGQTGAFYSLTLNDGLYVLGQGGSKDNNADGTYGTLYISKDGSNWYDVHATSGLRYGAVHVGGYIYSGENKGKLHKIKVKTVDNVVYTDVVKTFQAVTNTYMTASQVSSAIGSAVIGMKTKTVTGDIVLDPRYSNYLVKPPTAATAVSMDASGVAGDVTFEMVLDLSSHSTCPTIANVTTSNATWVGGTTSGSIVAGKKNCLVLRRYGGKWFVNFQYAW